FCCHGLICDVASSRRAVARLPKESPPMLFRWIWPQSGRVQADATRSRLARKIHLRLEILEDRLVPSITLFQWRHLRYSINDMHVLGAVSQSGSVLANAGTPVIQGGQLIGLDQALVNFPYRGNGYSVAVIDTGIDYNNPVFSGRVIAGWNFVN